MNKYAHKLACSVVHIHAELQLATICEITSVYLYPIQIAGGPKI